MEKTKDKNNRECFPEMKALVSLLCWNCLDRELRIPTEALVDIAHKLGNKAECTYLAAKLDFTEPDVIMWKNSTQPVYEIAEDILLKWSARTAGTKNGTQQVLEDALLDINRRDLRNIFVEKCDALKARNVTWELMCHQKQMLVLLF